MAEVGKRQATVWPLFFCLIDLRSASSRFLGGRSGHVGGGSLSPTQGSMMTNEDGEGGVERDGQVDGPAQTARSDHVSAALAAFETFRDELSALLCEVRLGETERAKKLAPLVSDLARAVTRIADEQTKLDARCGRREGAAHAALSLDLAAARAEVSRRLAELRDAGR